MLLAMHFDGRSIVQRKWKRFGPTVFKLEENRCIKTFVMRVLNLRLFTQSSQLFFFFFFSFLSFLFFVFGLHLFQ